MTPAEPHDSGRQVYLQLRRVARDLGRTFPETLMLYKLEATLARLSATTFRQNLVLKGGLLLAAYGARRPTKDIDAMLRDLSVDEQGVHRVCAAIAAVESDDGLQFDVGSLRVVEIREDAEYTGYRASMTCYLHTDSQKVSLDVSTGDPLDPPAREVTITGLLGDTISIQGYPPPMIVAEKAVTAITRGTVNTRWRDFVDLALISRMLTLNADEVRRSLTTVAAHRRAPLIPLRSALAGYGEIGQAKYAAWRTKQGLISITPARFGDLLEEVFRFIDPVLDSAGTAGTTWNQAARRWTR